MQKIATRIFIGASVAFGIIGILLVLTSPSNGGTGTYVNEMLSKLLMITVFIILPSFALSIASKYLNNNHKM